MCSCNPKSDMVFINAKVITVDSLFSIHEAIAIKHDKIIHLGTTEEILRTTNSNSKVYDLKGKTIIPGIYEGHVHPISASKSEYSRPLPDLNTIADLLNWIDKEVKTKKKGEWIIHPKLFPTRLMEARYPTLEELDSVAPENPLFLNGSYAAMVNTKALQVSDINQNLEYQGIAKDEVTKKMTGYIKRSGFKLLNFGEPNVMSREQRIDALCRMFEHYNQVGITSICIGSGNPKSLDLIKKLRKSGELTIRVFYNMSAPFSPHGSQSEIREALSNFNYKTGDGDEWIKVGSLKVFVDGGILTGTAFLREPWGVKATEVFGIEDPNYLGILKFSKDELVQTIKLAEEFGWKFAAHATGGGAVDTLLSAFETVDSTNQINGKRHSIIHGNFYDQQAITRMNKLGIYAEIQPAWYYEDADMINYVLDEEQARFFQPYRSMIESNITLNGGSDHMAKYNSYKSINPYNPFLSMWTMITRKTKRDNVYNSNESISRYEALKTFTINNAKLSFEEDIKGSLEVGKLADMIVLSDDILTCPVDDIRNIKVFRTIIGGKVVFQR